MEYTPSPQQVRQHYGEMSVAVLSPVGGSDYLPLFAEEQMAQFDRMLAKYRKTVAEEIASELRERLGPAIGFQAAGVATEVGSRT